MQQPVGKVIIVAGIILVIIGVTWYFLGNKFSWLGRLPGDIRIEKKDLKFYFPITTMIVISLVVTVLFHLIKKFL